MLKNLVELVFILDRSGSMSGLEQDTIGGFNSLIKKQKKEEGETIVSTILFNDKNEVIHDRVNINEIGILTENEYYAAGCTALLDAVGNSINHIVNVHKNLPVEERPSKTMFFITTDGMENSSKEYSYTKIRQLIEDRKEKDAWEFVFLGANIDSVAEATKLGIDADNACDYNCDPKGTKIIYDSMCAAISESRQNKRLSKSWRMNIDNDKKNRKLK